MVPSRFRPDFYVPLLPGNRHLHRCVHCGFLATGDGVSYRQIKGHERAESPMRYTSLACSVGAFELGEEIVGRTIRPDHLLDSTPEEMEIRYQAFEQARRWATTETVWIRRECPFFMRFRDGLTHEAHKRLQEREHQAFWSLMASALGGALALAGTALALLLS